MSRAQTDGARRPTVHMLAPTGRHHRHVEFIWGTAVTIDVRDPDGSMPSDDAVAEAVAWAVDEMKRVDRVFSTYRADSVVTALRTGARTEESLNAADPNEADVIEVIAACREARDLTEGCFNPWAVDGGFDPSGYVKGWAAELVADGLVERGADHVCVNAGGDVVTRGLAGPNLPWNVGVRHPEDASSVVRTFVSRDGAVATSGAYERGDHIVDPRRRSAAAAARSATVVGPNSGLAEVLSTALIVAGRDGARWFTSLPGYKAFVVDPLPAETAWSVGG